MYIYWMNAAAVNVMDYVTERTEVVSAGDQRTVASLQITVCVGGREGEYLLHGHRGRCTDLSATDIPWRSALTPRSGRGILPS